MKAGVAILAEEPGEQSGDEVARLATVITRAALARELRVLVHATSAMVIPIAAAAAGSASPALVEGAERGPPPLRIVPDPDRESPFALDRDMESEFGTAPSWYEQMALLGISDPVAAGEGVDAWIMALRQEAPRLVFALGGGRRLEEAAKTTADYLVDGPSRLIYFPHLAGTFADLRGARSLDEILEPAQIPEVPEVKRDEAVDARLDEQMAEMAAAARFEALHALTAEAALDHLV